jgi:hypothetical protein
MTPYTGNAQNRETHRQKVSAINHCFGLGSGDGKAKGTGFLSFFPGLELEFKASHLQSRLSTPPVHFALVILEMRSYELFAWAGLEP